MAAATISSATGRSPASATGSAVPASAAAVGISRSSSASRTGVAETPKRVASPGAEYTSPGRSSPAVSARRASEFSFGRRAGRRRRTALDGPVGHSAVLSGRHVVSL